MPIFFALGISIGLYLTWTRGIIVLLLGIIGVVSGLFYTAPSINWAGKGVGESLIGLNFGALMTLGAYYVQTGNLAVEPLVASIPVSLLIAAVVYINEFPDYNADKAVGKNTLVVRLGRDTAVYGYMALMLGAYAALAGGVLSRILPPHTLLGFIPLPLAIKGIRFALQHHSSSFDLVPANASTILCHLLTSLLLSLGYAIERFGPLNLSYVAFVGGLCAVFTAYMYRSIEKQKNVFLGLKKTVRT